MKATVLVDNIENEDLKGEWGLSIFIEYGDKNILLDAGQSGLFAENAKKMGISLEKTDYAVLSHAHYDHADGMRDFFAENEKADLYIRASCGENCYDRKEATDRYIGISEGMLEEYKDRITYVSGDYELSDGIHLIPHKTENLSDIGKRETMYLKENDGWRPDDFAHEQSLVFDTPEGLVVFNSCSHGGADNIIREIQMTYPGKKVRALIGGFHLYNKTEEYVREFAKRVKDTGIECIYTGHCTGEEAYAMLEEELGGIVHPLKVGLVMDFHTFRVCKGADKIDRKRLIELMRQTNWAKDRPEELILKVMENSRPYAVYDSEDYMVGYARIITDYATTFYLMDVIVDENYRRQGIGTRLMNAIMEDVGHLYGILHTEDAQGFYARYGFVTSGKEPDEIIMEKPGRC